MAVEPQRLADLAAHRVRRAALEHVAESRHAVERLRQLETRQTRPEQSKPPGTVIMLPGAVALHSVCVFSDMPAKTYGKPTKRSARVSTRRCQLAELGNDERRQLTDRHDPAWSTSRSFASEYAASARDAGSFGDRSSDSLRSDG